MYICKNCGYQTLKWLGRCPECQMWETFSLQEKKEIKPRKEIRPIPLEEPQVTQVERFSTGIGELDRVLGGGLIKGEVVLIGGEPGIGKSTLLLETGGKLSQRGKVLYISAEESLEQINLRAKRLNISSKNLYLLNEDEIVSITEFFKKNFLAIILDSIQTVQISALKTSKGSLLQVRESASILTEEAKKTNTSLFIVGHVTKDGSLSGPKVLEHIVDCVVYFEGERNSHYRILRAVKNRFGSTGEIGVFEMNSQGLKEVKNPSSIFISDFKEEIPGRCITCVNEGIRPIFIEIQALVTKGTFGVVRRKTSGFDFNRFSLLLAMLEKRMGFYLGNQDVFVNVAGGIKVNDPSADLGLVVAVASGFKDIPLSSNFVFIGEVGLGGELRRINQPSRRLVEAQRLGFKSIVLPKINTENLDLKKFLEIEIYGARNIGEVLRIININ